MAIKDSLREPRTLILLVLVVLSVVVLATEGGLPLVMGVGLTVACGLLPAVCVMKIVRSARANNLGSRGARSPRAIMMVYFVILVAILVTWHEFLPAGLSSWAVAMNVLMILSMTIMGPGLLKRRR